MLKLNLPPYLINLRANNGKQQIFDLLRNKYVALTPEEWVRQHFVRYLIYDRQFPQGLMANEMQIVLHRTRKRCDTVLFDKQRQPLVIIEYKAPSIPITQEVVNQILRYNIVLRVRYIFISNGLSHYGWKLNYEHQTYEILPEIPVYSSL